VRACVRALLRACVLMNISGWINYLAPGKLYYITALNSQLK